MIINYTAVVLKIYQNVLLLPDNVYFRRLVFN